MDITGPTYKRILDDAKLIGTLCKRDGNIFYGRINICTNCGREKNLEVMKLPREGRIYSSSLVMSAQDDMQFSDKLPYVSATIELKNGVKVPALIDSEADVGIGEAFECRIGKIGETERGIIIYRPIWQKKREYSKPAAREGKGRLAESNILSTGHAGIEGYGVYVPENRILQEEICRVWGQEPEKGRKSFPGKWDDSCSYAMNAALAALEHAGMEGSSIENVLVGSESHVHAVWPTAIKVAELIDSHAAAADLEFACKAGTHAMRSLFSEVSSEFIRYGLAIGTDSAQGAPNDALELTAGDAAAAFVIGKNRPIARLEGIPQSYSSDTPDFWRNENERFPRHEERFTGEPSYFKHTTAAAKKLLSHLKLEPEDFDYMIFHQPNSKFPRKVGSMLGFKPSQVDPGIVFDHIGNPYSATAMVGFAKVLDSAVEGERIGLVSYGSGAGSDAFSFITTKHISEKRHRIKRSAKSWLGEEDKDLLRFHPYSIYAKNKGLLRRR